MFVFQYVEYFIDRGVLGINKEVQHLVLEYRGDSVQSNTRHKWDSAQSLVVPVMPPSLTGITRLLQVYYVLKVMQRKHNYLVSITISRCLQNCFFFRILGCKDQRNLVRKAKRFYDQKHQGLVVSVSFIGHAKARDDCRAETRAVSHSIQYTTTIDRS